VIAREIAGWLALSSSAAAFIEPALATVTKISSDRKDTADKAGMEA
jgi:hypothetical protein